MSINIETQSVRRFFEVIKWTIVAILLIVAFVGNCLYYDRVILPLRALIVIILVITAIAVALSTTKGRAVVVFFRETRTEVYKVIWPTYKETLHTTLTVVVVTTVMSLVLWGLDGILVRLVSFITGLRF